MSSLAVEGVDDVEIDVDIDTDDNDKAEWLDIPQTLISTVEHPGIVKNPDAAVATLGGQDRLDKSLSRSADDQGSFLGLSFQPDDNFRRPLPADLAWTSNLVLKVTVPKRVGRKRKRAGSARDAVEKPGQFIESELPSTHPKDATYLLQSLRDNDEDYDVEPVGFVQDVYRFRGHPDFQFSLANSSLAQRLETDILPFRYDKMKRFKLNVTTRGTHGDPDIIPPPRLLNMGIPHHYMYLQNPYVEVDKTGQSMKNNFTPVKWFHQMLNYRQAPVPTKPTTGLLPESKLGKPVREMIHALRALFNERPITTRRVLYNNFDKEVHKMHLEKALEYCAYQFRSGPWRDCVIKFGVDPRTDPKYRHFQTFTFQVSPTLRKGGGQGSTATYTNYQANTPTSHIFDGKIVSVNVKMFAICDIVDPLLVKVLSAEPRASCEISREGWYQNGTWAKAKIIMHEKMKAFKYGRTLPDDYFKILLRYPESCSDLTETDRFKPGTRESHTLFSAYRGEIRTSLAGEKGTDHLEGSGDEQDDAADDKVPGNTGL